MRSARTLAATVALAASGLSVLAPTVALAAPAAPAAVAALPSVDPTGNISLIDPNATVSLDIHKYLGAAVDLPNNGTEQTVSLPALSGVVFDVYQVQGVNLTTNAGWAAATDLQGKTLTQTDITNGYVTGTSGTRYTLVKAGSVTTDATGTATFSKDAGTGLYLVNENLAASTSITNVSTGEKIASTSVTPASPFYVTLPMTQPNTTASWMYNVDVYPKNATNSITKQVVDPSTVSTSMNEGGDHTINYLLTGTITPGMTADQMGTYVIADKLPATGVTFDQIASVKTTGSAGAPLDAADYTVTNANGYVQVAMTPTGLTKLAAAKAADPAATVVVDLQVTATAPTGDLNNTAYLIPSNTWWQSATGNPEATYVPTTDTPVSDNGTPVTTLIPSNEVDTHLGQALLSKVDGADSTLKLAGATFDLYSKIIDATDMTVNNDLCDPIVTDTANRIMDGLVTGADGTLSITGLQESDYWNGTTQADQKIIYCAVETKAPAGYNLNAEPIAFYVEDYTATAGFTVTNEKSNLANNLPLTGGAGASILGLGGLAVVGGTLAARAIAKKRNEDEENELV